MNIYHRQAGNSFPEIPAEQWYYFFIMGLEQGRLETEFRQEKEVKPNSSQH